MQKSKMIYVVLSLVVSIVLAAFVLSFRTVSTVGNHFFPGFGWIFALLIDAGMIVLGLVRLLAGVMNQPAIKKWAVGGLAVALLASFVLNIVTVDGRFASEWLHWLAHGLPPVALLALSELALQIYDVSRETAVSPHDKLMAKATTALLRWRKRLVAQRHALAKLREQLETAVAGRDADLVSHQQEVAKLTKQLETAVAERDNLSRKIDKDYIPVAKLPERMAYAARAMANGRVPNGDFVERFGVGATTAERAMAVMWPKEERPA